MIKVGYNCCHTFIESWLGPESIVLDLGMNEGQFAKYIIQKIGCKVYGAEPNPELYSRLPKLDRLATRQAALWGTSGRATLNISPQWNADASLVTREKGATAVDVETLSFEDFLQTFGVTQVDLAKLDIEGAEIEMFDRAPDDVLRRVAQFTIEFHDFLDPRTKPDVKRVLRRLESLGFQKINFSYFGRHLDVLLINRKLRKLGTWEWLYVVAFHKYLPGIRRRLNRMLGRDG